VDEKVCMKTAILIRIAAVLTFIHAVLHTIGGVFGGVDPGPATVAAAAMKSNQFVAMGNLRTYWDFYMGMGLAVTIFLTTESVVLWLLSSLAHSHASQLRPILIVFAIGYLVFAIDSYRYFFVAPVITEILIGLCLVAAAISARPAVEMTKA
jgi:hypothetical protein